MGNANVDKATDGNTSMAYSRADLAVGEVDNGQTDASGFFVVVFPTPLTAVPTYVDCSAIAPDGGGLDPPAFGLIDSKSTTGFTVRWWRDSSTQLLYNSRAISFMWVAILG